LSGRKSPKRWPRQRICSSNCGPSLRRSLDQTAALSEFSLLDFAISGVAGRTHNAAMLTRTRELTDQCPECGIAIPPAAPEGLCPRCLALRAVGTLFEAVTSVESLAERRFFGDYELIEEAGRGG